MLLPQVIVWQASKGIVLMHKDSLKCKPLLKQNNVCGHQPIYLRDEEGVITVVSVDNLEGEKRVLQILKIYLHEGEIMAEEGFDCLNQ